jgi:hypothetical protein
MDLILWLQALEPRAAVRLVFAGISWCGECPCKARAEPVVVTNLCATGRV